MQTTDNDDKIKTLDRKTVSKHKSDFLTLYLCCIE